MIGQIVPHLKDFELSSATSPVLERSAEAIEMVIQLGKSYIICTRNEAQKETKNTIIRATADLW